MRGHLTIKAFVMLVAIMFHSLVLVPKAHATTFEGILGRVAFRALAPSVIGGMAGGMGIVAGVVIGGGLGYILYKSGAVTAMKNWLLTQLGATPPTLASMSVGSYCTFNIKDGSGYAIPFRAKKYSDTSCSYQMFIGGAWGSEVFGPGFTTIAQAAEHARASWGGSGQQPYNFSPGGGTAPSVPTDYATALATTQPDFATSGQIYATPGAAAALSGGAAISSVAQASDSDIAAMISGLGATEVNGDTGAQVGSPGATNDNTYSVGDSAQVGLLQSIMNYVSNLMGIKTAVEAQKATLDNTLVATQAMKTAIDNVGTGIVAMRGSMDNVGTGIAAMRNTMDNVGLAIQSQAADIDAVKDSVQSLDNALTLAPSGAAVSAISTRLDGIYDTMMTRFPFSWFSVVPAPSGLDTGTSPDVLAHIGGVEIDYSPWKNSGLNSILSTVKGMIGLFLWAVCAVGIYRRITLGES